MDKVEEVIDLLRDTHPGANEAPLHFAAAQMLEQMRGSLRAIAICPSGVTGGPEMVRLANAGLKAVGADIKYRRAD